MQGSVWCLHAAQPPCLPSHSKLECPTAHLLSLTPTQTYDLSSTSPQQHSPLENIHSVETVQQLKRSADVSVSHNTDTFIPGAGDAYNRSLWREVNQRRRLECDFKECYIKFSFLFSAAVSESDSDRSASPPPRRNSPKADSSHMRYKVLPDLAPPNLRSNSRGSSPYRPPPPPGQHWTVS